MKTTELVRVTEGIQLSDAQIDAIYQYAEELVEDVERDYVDEVEDVEIDSFDVLGEEVGEIAGVWVSYMCVKAKVYTRFWGEDDTYDLPGWTESESDVSVDSILIYDDDNNVYI